MSLIEVLIALGMVGILTSVIATVMQQMQKAQSQVNVINTIENMRLNIQKLATDGTAWRATVARVENSGAGLPLECVRTNALCTDSGASAILSNETVANAVIDAAPFLDMVSLDQASGGSFINTSVADSGYTEKGTPCVGWTAAGNDACPMRWVMKIALECQTPPTCLNPTIRVIGLLYYRTSNQRENRAIINESKYRVDIRRGAQGDSRAERFQAVFESTSPVTPGGACASTGTVVPYATQLVNDNANVTLAGGGVMNFQAGTYTCTASSSCFACGSVRLALTQAGVESHSSVSLLSKRWEQTQVSINNATFTLNATTPIRIVQYCATDPGGLPAIATFNLGMAIPSYTTNARFAEIQCTRIF